jgi:hypothetical protein
LLAPEIRTRNSAFVEQVFATLGNYRAFESGERVR